MSDPNCGEPPVSPPTLAHSHAAGGIPTAKGARRGAPNPAQPNAGVRCESDAVTSLQARATSEGEGRPPNRQTRAMLASSQARKAGLGGVGAPELLDNPRAALCDGIKVDPGVDAEPIEHEDHILCGHIPSGPRAGKRAAT